MPITRKFLDWNRPALPAVVELLVQRYDVRGTVDLRNVILVVPGGRARQRLIELLGERLGVVLDLQWIITPEGLPEQLYAHERGFAPELVQQLAWTAALRATPRDDLASVLPRPPADEAFEQWLSLGELVWSQHRELAADGLDFADVAARGTELEGFDERDRWQTLRRVQERYLDSLDDLGLWDKQTARLYAIEHGECATEKDVVLVATADLNATLRQMLDQVADRVTALVHAPPSLAERFDAHGCLVPAAWQEVPIEVDESRVHVVGGPVEQAGEVARVLAGYDGRYRPDEISVGVPDESLVPQIERQLQECGVETRWVAGRTIGETASYRLLAAITEQLDGRRFDTFAALVRHPDVHDWLARRESAPGWLAAIDRYYSRRLQAELGDWAEEDADDELVRHVHASVEALLAPLAGPDRPLDEWTKPVVGVLLTVYDGLAFDRDDAAGRSLLQATRTLHAAFAEHAEVPASLAPTTNAAAAIRLALERVAGELIPPLPAERAIEILGWLELPLDDAEALVVTSFNEGFVPKSVNSHLFLPNALRTRLGILDNDRRYARDAYALSAILASRQRVDLIVGRRDTHDDPLPPSRLLFATDADEIAGRLLRFLEPSESPPPLAGSLTAGRSESALYVPRPRPLAEPVRKLSVTAFRDYLACPYRFYLKHVLKLDEVDDSAEELDGGTFGTVIHEVLAHFGRSEVRDSTDAATIREFLRADLDAEVERRHGSGRRAAVNVQVEQMRVRLDRFADWQANWAAEGWRIAFVEQPEHGTSIRFPAEGEPAIELRGRIDRIDRLRDEDEWIVFDYKTGETGKSPQQVHQKGKAGGEWIDLQLPLYRHLLKPLGITGDVRLGFILLPRDLDTIGERLAEWSAEQLAEADALAIETVERIVSGEFWPPATNLQYSQPAFAGICQDNALEARLAP